MEQVVKSVNNKKGYSLFIFIVIVLASGWLGVFVDSILTEQPEGDTLGMGLFIILPFISMLIIRLVTRDWKDIGIKLNLVGNGKWYLAALGAYPVVMMVTVGLALLLGGSSISDFDWKVVASVVGVSFAGNILKNIFEEFSWRGYLTPKLIERKLNDWAIYLISGLVWALWHAPYYMVFLPDHFFETLSRTGFVLTGCVLMTAWTIMYVEIYRLTKSVWPCILMHAAEDAIPTLLVTISGIITFTKTAGFWLDPTTGVVTTALFIAIGLALRSVRRKVENRAQAVSSQVHMEASF